MIYYALREEKSFVCRAASTRACLDTLHRTIKALLTVSTGSSLVLSFFRVVYVVVFVVQTLFSASAVVFVFFLILSKVRMPGVLGVFSGFVFSDEAGLTD